MRVIRRRQRLTGSSRLQERSFGMRLKVEQCVLTRSASSHRKHRQNFYGRYRKRRFAPTGGGRAKPISTRILASSSRDLASMVEQGKFRRDLYFRFKRDDLEDPRFT